jgi:hypothetical protein
MDKIKNSSGYKLLINKVKIYKNLEKKIEQEYLKRLNEEFACSGDLKGFVKCISKKQIPL